MAARGHATHIDGIVLNVTKFRIQILCSLHCVMGRSSLTFSTMLSMSALLEVTCPLAAFGGSMRP